MRVQKICVIVIVFVVASYIAFSCISSAFAQCPPDYELCGNVDWCCTSLAFCANPTPPNCVPFAGPPTTIGGGLCPSETIYGEHSEETELLRYFRDNILAQTPEGQEIIRLYYEWSPVIIRAMEEDEEFKEEVKEMVDGVLELIGGELE